MDDHSRCTASADAHVIDTLLNACSRDLVKGMLRHACPRHDDALRSHWARQLGRSWMRFPLDAISIDIYAPLSRHSLTGRHRFATPVLARRRGDDDPYPVGVAEVAELLESHYRATHPDSEATPFCTRVLEGRDNVRAILERHRRCGSAQPRLEYLACEGALTVGHPFHPLAKSRFGFTPEESERYAPELGGRFALHYWLAHPSCVLEQYVGVDAPADRLRTWLLEHATLPAEVRSQIAARPDWRLVPLHPWEARHLRGHDAVATLMRAGKLVDLGICGEAFAATSSVRTVYSERAPYQFKLSLHVALTNCERINYLHEMRKGVGIATLLGSAWGLEIERRHPQLKIMRDVAFVALHHEGRMIEGTGTVLRENDVRAEQRVVVAAALCEPEVEGTSALRQVLTEFSHACHRDPESAAIEWFRGYLDRLFAAVLGPYQTHGLVLEAHLQNILVDLNDDGAVNGVRFRDNQGFFLRDAVASTVLEHAPELRHADPCLIGDEFVERPYNYYLFVNNVICVLQAIADLGVVGEARLCSELRVALEPWRKHDHTGFVARALEGRAWTTKANLLMALENRDELRRPSDNPANYIDVENPLLLGKYFSHRLLAPSVTTDVHTHAFAEFEQPLRMRPFHLERDLEFIYDWVNRDYAKQYWGMHGPRRGLEEWYIELAASDATHAFVGCLGDEPKFIIETYWSARDPVGRYYDSKPTDYGYHILVGPPDVPMRGLTRRIVQFVVEFMLRHGEVGRVVAEADWRNEPMERLLRMVGYESAGHLELPEKRAHLMFCTRENFVRACPDSAPYIVGATTSFSEGRTVLATPSAAALGSRQEAR